MPTAASSAFFGKNMTADMLYSVMHENGKNQEEQWAEFESFAQRSITKPIQSVIRGEQQQVDRLLRGLRVALAADLDRMMQELGAAPCKPSRPWWLNLTTSMRRSALSRGNLHAVPMIRRRPGKQVVVQFEMQRPKVWQFDCAAGWGWSLRLRHQVQRFAIKGGNQPIDRYGFAGLLEAGDLRAANARASALQLDKSKVQDIGVLAADAENDRVDNTGTGRSGSALEKRHAPLVRFAVPAQGFLTGSFSGADLCKGIQAFLGCHGLCGSHAALAGERRLLAGGEIG